MELVELVVAVHLTQNTPIKMRKSQLQRNQRERVLVTCMLMASRHCDACLTLMLGHPTLLAMRTHCHPNVRPPVMIVRNTHPILMPTSLLPTCMSPPLFTGSAHEGGCIFVPTPSRPTPPLVHVEPTQEPSLPNPYKQATLATAKAR